MNLINKYLDMYGPAEDERLVKARVDEILKASDRQPDQELLKRIFSLIDLTSLNPEDNVATARKLCEGVNRFPNAFPGHQNVAAICVYPALVSNLKENLDADGVHIAAVGAGFPASQTFLSVKLAECELLSEKGADEIDIVISVGKMLAGEFNVVFDEIYLIKQMIGNTHLKVILETGLLQTPENIRLASLIAMEAGADFIKTSTGKVNPAATHEAVYTMVKAIQDYYSKTGKAVGIKPAGGISSPHQASEYYALVEHVLGAEWLRPERFRIGASRLANNLLSAITSKEISHF